MKIPTLLLFIFSSGYITTVHSSTAIEPTPVTGNHVPSIPLRQRFQCIGPLLTVTLKDPFATSTPDRTQQEIPITTDNEEEELNEQGNPRSLSSPTYSSRRSRWMKRLRGSKITSSNFLGLSSLSPTLLYSIRSKSQPLPNYLPNLKSTSFTAGYKYEELKNVPSFVEGELLFYSERLGLDLDVAPSYEVKRKQAAVAIRVGTRDDGANGRGVSAMVRLTNKGRKLLDYIRGSYKMSFPFQALSTLTITPAYDFTKAVGYEPSCVMMGKSASGRTAAIVDLNWINPTLTVLHALDERNTISPEINLYDAKIMYNWNVALNNGSIRTRVDPTSAIQVTWTDQSTNGKWVTDFKMPLVGAPGPLASDIRVRRQFQF